MDMTQPCSERERSSTLLIGVVCSERTSSWMCRSKAVFIQMTSWFIRRAMRNCSSLLQFSRICSNKIEIIKNTHKAMARMKSDLKFKIANNNKLNSK